MEGSEAQLDGSEAQLEGSKGHLEGSKVQPRRDGQTNGQTDGRTNGKSPHSTGLCPLLGPLPKSAFQMNPGNFSLECF